MQIIPQRCRAEGQLLQATLPKKKKSNHKKTKSHIQYSQVTGHSHYHSTRTPALGASAPANTNKIDTRTIRKQMHIIQD